LTTGIPVNYFIVSDTYKYISTFAAETVQELDSNLQAAVDAMKNTDYPVTAVASGCELFLRFITLAKLDTKVN
jgi:translation initiation factor eIF-2B subunit alpha